MLVYGKFLREILAGNLAGNFKIASHPQEILAGNAVGNVVGKYSLRKILNRWEMT